MMNLDLEYLNHLARQILLISSLLGGFSIAIVANLLTEKSNSKIMKCVFKTTTLAAGCFLVSIFAMTKLVMMTTKGYPVKVSSLKLDLSNNIGSLSFLLGIFFICLVIGLSGWTKSKKIGVFTSIISTLTFLLVLLIISYR